MNHCHSLALRQVAVKCHLTRSDALHCLVNMAEQTGDRKWPPSAWEADVLPLNYIRLTRHFVRSCPLADFHPCLVLRSDETSG